MKILTIDTASDMCMCMIKNATGIKHALIENISRGHAERLILQIDELCKQANCPLNELDAICVNTGPGSFTGIRIGTAAARGLQLALQKPAIGISYFTALGLYAYNLHPDKNIAVIFKAYNGYFHCAFWPHNKEKSEKFFNIENNQTLALEELKAQIKDNYIIIGDAELINNITIKNAELLKIFDHIARHVLKNMELINNTTISYPPKPIYMLPYKPHIAEHL